MPWHYQTLQTRLRETGFAPDEEQYQVLTELIGVLAHTPKHGPVGRLSSLFFIEGHSEDIKMLFSVQTGDGGMAELSVLLPLLSGRNVILQLVALQNRSGITEFHVAIINGTEGAISGLEDPAARELLLTLFSLLPEPANPTNS